MGLEFSFESSDLKLEHVISLSIVLISMILYCLSLVLTSLRQVQRVLRTPQSLLESVTPDGGTSFAQALQGAQTVLRKAKNLKKHHQFLLLMSDGQSHDGEVEMKEIYDEFGEKMKVHTLAFGTRAQVDKLKALAQLGGGSFLKAVDGVELVQAFEQVAYKLTHRET
ncbi:hypothetical protein GUITHDRAFT_119384 [Guillardia theta CCMP2712]|uniref:VWFA domain-containing protein n=1 Tax=Guillardia theta (strain CCMP2712) TaxID=905079 RepID=L1IDW5_GUITC|nr:hypothetical protein GUITHDRAFT_119384 [Guillardia theta CCMP2712]EKX34461.1 hypothetical protein GUITHDRAFT_119384 [Guillardia theta CCMP2712]|eukprot:XP_005821441.1 hypothetical protein GUITHDRAFT_119384 [Guillardia theta CCMP2712]